MRYSGDKLGRVVVAVRPEHIFMTQDKGTLRGTLTHSYYLGDVNDCRVDVDGNIIRVIASGRSYGEIKAGSQVWLDFDEYLVFQDDGVDYTKILS